MIVEHVNHQRQREENSSGIFSHFGERIATARAEKCVRCAGAKSLPEARLFFGQLHQHQQNENERVEHQHDR